jgi:hypothetical protein
VVTVTCTILVATLWLPHGIGVAGAQERESSTVTDPRLGQAVSARPGGDAARLAGLRQHFLDERRREGLALLVWGSMNVVGGSIVAGIQHDDGAWLSASLTTLGFGLVNALLALPLLDLAGTRRAAILREQTDTALPFDRLRDREVSAQLKSGQVFALNLGLDLLYLATGAFLLGMAQRDTRHAEWERGVGTAFMVQAPFLFGFDLVCWMRANRRAAELGQLR